MLITSCGNGGFHRIAARSLPTEQLIGQWEDMLNWIDTESEEVVNSKFSMETAWFRELWYELTQRNLLQVN